MRRLALTQTPVNRYQPTLVWKDHLIKLRAAILSRWYILFVSPEKLKIFLSLGNIPDNLFGQIGYVYRIHQLHMCRGVRFPVSCLEFNTKQSDGETSIMLEVWGMLSTSSLPWLSGPLCTGVVAPGRPLSMDQIGLNCLLMLNWIVWNRSVLTNHWRSG